MSLFLLLEKEYLPIILEKSNPIKYIFFALKYNATKTLLSPSVNPPKLFNKENWFGFIWVVPIILPLNLLILFFNLNLLYRGGILYENKFKKEFYFANSNRGNLFP